MRCGQGYWLLHLRADLAKIPISILIMLGKKDKIYSLNLAEQMKASLLNSQFEVFKNIGHSLFPEKTQEFNTELIKFARE